MAACVQFDNGDIINKVKYKSEEEALARIDVLKTIDVIKKETIPYVCKKCGSWHIGDLKIVKKYGK